MPLPCKSNHFRRNINACGRKTMFPEYIDEAAAAPAADDLTSKLKQLAELRAAGILDDAEFSAAKAKLLSA